MLYHSYLESAATYLFPVSYEDFEFTDSFHSSGGSGGIQRFQLKPPFRSLIVSNLLVISSVPEQYRNEIALWPTSNETAIAFKCYLVDTADSTNNLQLGVREINY